MGSIVRASGFPGPVPRGHFGWISPGAAALAAKATSFLAEGAARGERLFYVAEEPDPRHWPGWLLEQGILQLASVEEVYGDLDLEIDGLALRYEQLIERSLADGFRGLCVVTEVGRFAASPARLGAWLHWEELAGRAMHRYPVTALCAFDAEAIDRPTAELLRACHPRWLAG